jgi:hypothetical protein
MTSFDGDSENTIDELLRALAARDWPGVRLLLHPYLHWTEDGTTLRGRNLVLQRLADGPPPAPPGSYELRDGQIYRWTSAPAEVG